MIKPKLKNVKRKLIDIPVSGGLYAGENAPSGFFTDEKNLTGDLSPLLSVRRKRAFCCEGERQENGIVIPVSGIFLLGGEGVTAAAAADGRLCVSTAAKVFAGGKEIAGAELTSEGRRQIIPLGRNFFISPDGLYFENTGEGFTVTRADTMPVTDFVTQSGNRLWGCRCGRDKNGNEVNEIYASSPGDPTRWQPDGSGANSPYAVSLGCPGPFTGAAAMPGAAVFFKEDAVITVRGLTPADFTVEVTYGRGVEKGCDRTLVTLNEELYYKSPAGVARFDGAAVYDISRGLMLRPSGAKAAGAADGKYYLSAGRDIFVFDTRSGLWHKEETPGETEFFIPLNNTLYLLMRTRGETVAGIDMSLWRICVHDAALAGGAGGLLPPADDCETVYIDEKEPEWYCVTPVIPLPAGREHRLRKLIFSLSGEKDATFYAGISAGDFNFTPVSELTFSGDKELATVNAVTPALSEFRLKLGGKGNAVIYSVKGEYD